MYKYYNFLKKYLSVSSITNYREKQNSFSKNLSGASNSITIKKSYLILILLQPTLLGFIALGFAFTNGWFGSKSFLLGGSAWFVPNLYFLWKTKQIKSVFGNCTLLNHFFSSEVIKLCLSFIMMIFILLICSIEKKWFLSGYAVMILITLIIPLGYGLKND